MSSFTLTLSRIVENVLQGRSQRGGGGIALLKGGIPKFKKEDKQQFVSSSDGRFATVKTTGCLLVKPIEK
ncbi:hypothetical protein PanWU01x14_101690, partial [Parasponia andersonii]